MDDPAEHKWAVVSPYPYGACIAAEEEKMKRVAAAWQRVAPDASEQDRRRAAWDVWIVPELASRIAPPAVLKAEIKRLQKALAGVEAALSAMSPGALDAIDLATEHQLRDVGASLSRAYRRSRDEGPLKDVSEITRRARIRRGARPARAVTWAAATAFRELTGRPPTVITPVDGGKARGPFIELLTVVFDVEGIRASPEAQARAVIKLMEKTGT